MFLQGILLLLILPLVEDSVYLYNTEDSLSTEFYDCLTHDNLLYCRRPTEPIALQRDESNWQCHQQGVNHSFASLARNNVSVGIVLYQWKSSIEKAEEYSRYKKQLNKLASDDEKHLCECNHLESFGKNCEYSFLIGTTFEETVHQQMEMRSNRRHSWDMQMYGDIICYTTLDCDFGLLCLDWRDICDGVQQCMMGYDEENCDKLEFNECDDNEYRCLNGMCVPEKYFLDGDYDCLDMTDEKEYFDDTECTYESISYQCDDRLCSRGQWSCGDGQCISDRIHFQKDSSMGDGCENAREQYHMCETHQRETQWTLPNGKCYTYDRNDWDEEILYESFSIFDECLYSVKCALSHGAAENCLCNKSISCINEMVFPCHSSVVRYPNGGIVAPYISYYYNLSRDWTTNHPDWIEINGTIKCRGYMSNIYMKIEYSAQVNLNKIEEISCMSMSNISTSLDTGYNQFCYNDSQTFNNHSYHFIDVCNQSQECISAYRVKDSYKDCANEEDEHQTDLVLKTCSNISSHRFRCSTYEPTCLFVSAIGNGIYDCENGYDEVWMGVGVQLSKINCNAETKHNCDFLRRYVQESWKIDTNNSSSAQMNSTKISFRSFCDTFWDLGSATDETIDMCRKWWICPENQWQCGTGQCIEVRWVLDGEWDCSDASDEEALFTMDDTILTRNVNMVNKSQLIDKFKIDYNLRPFWNICNLSTEYPCFRVNISDPFNIIANRPCIDFKKIGDSHIDCIGAIDERNTIQHCQSPGMLGHHFQCSSETCESYSVRCGRECPNNRVPCYKNNSTNCSHGSDFMCFDGKCALKGKCNGKLDCSYGEDEYMCLRRRRPDPNGGLHPDQGGGPRPGQQGGPRPGQEGGHHPGQEGGPRPGPQGGPRPGQEGGPRPGQQGGPRPGFDGGQDPGPGPMPFPNEPYRERKEQHVKETRKHMQLPRFPNVENDKNGTAVLHSKPRETLQKNINFSEMSPFTLYLCNRGIVVQLYNKSLVCFCPPQYYGDRCEFHSDRLSILFHLNLSQSVYAESNNRQTILQLLIIFLYKDQPLMTQYSHIRPTDELKAPKKQIHHLLYSRSSSLRKLKQDRYLNRSNIIHEHPYSIRIEAYELQLDKKPQLAGIWLYPIYFDFLPNFRLAKVLHFTKPDVIGDPCTNISCNRHQTCHRILNKKSDYVCLYRSDFIEENCSIKDKMYEDSFCSSNALCKPNYRGLLSGNQQPYCICPLNDFGHRCSLMFDKCQPNPCQHDGTCLATSEINKFVCLCTDQYHGDVCELEKQAVQLYINESLEHRAGIVQYFNIDFYSLDLTLVHQDFYIKLPHFLHHLHDKETAPEIIVVKLYSDIGNNIHLISVQTNMTSINGTTQLTENNRCVHVNSLFERVNEVSPFKYHDVCRNKPALLCFVDDSYLCICDKNHMRVECFDYDHSLHECSQCVGSSQCLKQNQSTTDFLCICSKCYYGRLCQYNTREMSFTLDSLIVQESYVVQLIYLSITAVIFCLGGFTNYASFVTFKRSIPRKIGAGNYLLIISILNEISLLSLFIKMIHIVFNSYFGNISCKLITYILSVSVRYTHWITSWLTLERVCFVLLPFAIYLKNPRIALLTSFLTLIGITGMHVHELIFYINKKDPIGQSVCVANFPSFVSKYDYINVLSHHLIPFFIQIISVTLLIVLTARRRSRMTDGYHAFFKALKREFNKQKEFYVTPLIIVLSGLPQIIISSTFSCMELTIWQRYLLSIAYFLSYTPQILGFILYVLPSTNYSNEFRKTNLSTMCLFKYIGKPKKTFLSTVSRITIKNTDL